MKALESFFGVVSVNTALVAPGSGERECVVHEEDLDELVAEASAGV